MKHTLLTAAALLLLGISTTSCLDNDNDKTESKATYNYSSVFNSVTDLNDGTTFYTPDCTYSLTLNYTDATLSFNTTNLQLSATSSPGSLAVNNLPYKYNSANNTLTVRVPTATDIVSASAGSKITDVNFSLLDRNIGVVYSPLVQLNYIVDNRYQISVIPQQLTYYGSLTSVNKATGDTYTGDNLTVNVTIEPRKGTANIELKNIKFVEAMPRALDMVFPGIPFTTSTDGYSLTSTSLVPTINNDPFPSYPITNLSGTAHLSTGTMSLLFNCHPAGMDMYDVTINLKPTSSTSTM